jgi:hypothetical protein
MRIRVSILIPLSVMSIGLTSCYPDPFENPGDWSMTGASRQNIAAQAANPVDLLNGRSDLNSNGVAASAAIDAALGGAAGNASGLQKPPPAITFTSGTGN